MIFFDNENWVAVDDMGSRGGNSEMIFSDAGVEKESGYIFHARLVPIKGYSGPVGFALARRKIKPESLKEKFSFSVSSKFEFILSVSVINFAGSKYQYDLKVKQGENLYELSFEDFILSKWGKSYGEKLKSFKDIEFFEHGVLYSRQGETEYKELDFKWSLSNIR